MALTAAGLHARQDTGVATFLYLAVGTGSQTGNDEDQTALAIEIDRVAITATNVVGALASFAALLTSGEGNGTLTELGIFDAAVAGNLLTYQHISPALTKAATSGMILRVSDTLANG
jgi:hypothetical protein